MKKSQRDFLIKGLSLYTRDVKIRSEPFAQVLAIVHAHRLDEQDGERVEFTLVEKKNFKNEIEYHYRSNYMFFSYETHSQ